jgi:predicted nucleic acid-binding protein
VSVGYVEATSALARMRKGERVTSGQLREKREILEQLWRSASVHVTSDVLIDSATRVAREDALRAYDAIHLAAALSFAQVERLNFACWDRELREAAKRRGFALVPESL